ncbi:hypothetical protein WME94_26345 [Sorangium sp. So ce429]
MLPPDGVVDLMGQGWGKIDAYCGRRQYCHAPWAAARISDVPTGALLFAGRVNDPTAR